MLIHRQVFVPKKWFLFLSWSDSGVWLYRVTCLSQSSELCASPPSPLILNSAVSLCRRCFSRWCCRLDVVFVPFFKRFSTQQHLKCVKVSAQPSNVPLLHAWKCSRARKRTWLCCVCRLFTFCIVIESVNDVLLGVFGFFLFCCTKAFQMQ